jgi:hypothetical protein
MADASRPYPELVAWLEENGYSEPEIAQVLDGVRRYEERIGLDTVMESIAAGTFDLNAIIEETLKKGERKG